MEDSEIKCNTTSIQYEISEESHSSKQKSRTRGKKRKRNQSSESSTDVEDILPDNAFEFEKNVYASAVKNNLDDASVKKILKKVVTNDHVLALVKLKEEEEEGEKVEVNQYPKLTRAKVKELRKVSPRSAPWNLENLELTPIKHIPVKTRPEVEALIAQELPEDEDDDEYQPTLDDVPSDDDQTLESCSDLDSMPRTPATPQSHTASPRVVTDGPFKVPPEIRTPVSRKIQLEEATIALRTRSKINLSSTTIEHIESSFVPPDDIPMQVDDDLWSQFLMQCLDPASNSKLEDDDEADPEYNVAADPDANDEDEEALENSIIKISKKELNDLVTELFSVMPEDCIVNINQSETNGQLTATHWEGKQEPLSDEETTKTQETVQSRHSFSIGKTEPQDILDKDLHTKTTDANVGADGESEKRNAVTPNVRICVEEVISRMRPAREPPPPPFVISSLSDKTRQQNIIVNQTVECSTGDTPSLLLVPRLANKTRQHIIVNQPVRMLSEQVLILQQQLRQHIQLAASNFLQLFVHPEHWQHAPTYKEFLESFYKIGEENSKSVVNVCNLKPAVDLIKSWEASVSDNTPENIKMVEFIQKQVERNRRRAASNGWYVGEFHETFMKVVANSTVFLYPYLLPPMPYRSDVVRKFSYNRSEDELIAIGLDEFWDYVENNPKIYKPPAKVHPRHRWGVTYTAQLICKHMMTWYTPKTLMGHIHFVRKHGDKDNPINKFFKDREVTPVTHKLLPFNPELTLFEQPEHEMPRIWVRYLAKTSKRFRNHYYKRGVNIAGRPSEGVSVEIGKLIELPKKNPLPITFTKEIKCYRADMQPVTPKIIGDDKIDLIISKANEQATSTGPSIVSSNIFSVIPTSTGTVLIPISDRIIEENVNESGPKSISTEDSITITNDANIVDMEIDVNKTKVPELQKKSEINTVTNDLHCKINCVHLTSSNEIISNIETDNDNVTKISAQVNEIDDPNHCKCCILLRRICKEKQTYITDYFRYRNRARKNCPCSKISHPKISNKLRLLANMYKSQASVLWRFLQNKLKIVKMEINKDCSKNDTKEWLPKFDFEELACVISYQMRLAVRTGIARNNYIKRRLYTLFSRFEPDKDCPLWLANEIFKVFDVELVDMFKEFLGFLTAEQADRLDRFKDHFVYNCMADLIKKIEELVRDKFQLKVILSQLSSVPTDNVSTACEICSGLLSTMKNYPELAQYTFSLFPHVKNLSIETKDSQENGNANPAELEISIEPQTNGDRETDERSSSDEEDTRSSEDTNLTRATMNPEEELEYNILDTRECGSGGYILDTPELTVSKTEVQDTSNDDTEMSMLIMSDDETVKSEPQEWSREEDKLILELLKESLTPEERKDKTIIEILLEKNVFELISRSLIDKSVEDIKSRVIYLLEILVLSDK